MKRIDRQTMLGLLVEYFGYEELRTLAVDVGMDFDRLRGEDKASKALELVVYMERHGRLKDLVEAMRTAGSDQFAEVGASVGVEREWDSFLCLAESFKGHRTLSEVGLLKGELAGLRQQLDEVRDGVVSGEELEHRIEEMVKTATRAMERSEELKARLLLPPQDVTDVRLLPSNALERLEEYRTDENVVFLLIGVFGGAILGILSNWATSDPFVIMRFSIVLMILLGVLAGGCVWWAWRLRQRAEKVKERMFCGEGAAGPEVVD